MKGGGFALDGSSYSRLHAAARGDGRRRFLLTGLAASLAAGLGGVAATDGEYRRLILNTAFGAPISTPDRTGFFDRLMRAVFSALGHAVAIQSPPAERALMLADAGIDDGDGPRIPGLDNVWNYPNLVRVPEKLLDVEFNAFTLQEGIAVSQWDDLAAYQVGIVTGWKILEQKLAEHPGLVKVKDPDRLFLLLKNSRAEVVVIDRFSGVEAARHLGIEGLRILQPALVVTPMYLYLNRRHAGLARRVADELRAMKHDGRYRTIYRETLSHVDE